MIFISAGHNSKSKKVKRDPGAVANGYKEGDLAIEFRNLVCKELDALRVPYITDSDEETLAMYLQRIRTGSGSVVIEYHFDAATNSAATGTTGLIEAAADRLDKAFAKELTDTTAAVLGIRNRGVIDEGQSHRGRLGLMREDGIICLLELGFISNRSDLDRYFANKDILARRHAEIIVKYENIIP
ncbi:N-acetylmuramoyl-L-alanine amidase [Niabella insulamsoli]|uniref:N-acetylmuramoyl-L-alanine amidase n=1 Tax=Niabella insulamsoli TaxID=3144874 RepID=UPI0031FD5182